MSLITCPECSQKISSEANKCISCGYPITRKESSIINTQNIQTVQIEYQYKWSRGLAILLSIMIPGAGQLYKGSVLSAFLWFVFVSFTYFFMFPLGPLMHLLCILGAASGDPTK